MSAHSKPYAQRTHKRQVEITQINKSPRQIADEKNARCHARNLARKAENRKMEAERAAKKAAKIALKQSA